MSTLTENLQTIYEVKQEIKQVLGTSSDIFTQYPDLIEAAIGQGGGGLDWDEVASYGYIVPAGTINMKTNQNYDVSAYAYANVQVAVSTGSAYFYLVRNPEEENEETFNFTDDSATAGYPCFSYNFGDFEYTQGSLAQQIIEGVDDPYENPNGLDINLIKARIESPMFTTSEDGSELSTVSIYVSGPLTIEGAWEEGDGGGQVQMATSGPGTELDGQPQVYTLVSINNLTLHIYKPDAQSVWSCYWDWEIPE